MERPDKICAGCDEMYWSNTIGVWIREEWYCVNCFYNWIDDLDLEELATELGCEVGQ